MFVNIKMNNGVGFSIANRGRPVSTVEIEKKVQPKVEPKVYESPFNKQIKSNINGFKKDLTNFRGNMKAKKEHLMMRNDLKEDPVVPGPQPNPVVPGPQPNPVVPEDPIEEDPVVPGPVVSNKESMFFF